MKIAVCVNHVPDSASRIKADPDGKSADKNGITWIINPYDEFAVEEALKFKEKSGSGTEVTVFSLGGESNKETIRKAIAMGADNGVLLKDDNPGDSFAVAQALAEELKPHNFDIIFCGKQSIDYDNSIIPQLLAELLNYSCATVVVDLKTEGNKLIAEREIEGGREVVELGVPAVIGAQKGLNEPRYASLKGIMAAKKKVIEEKPALKTIQGTEITKMYLPPGKKPGRILGTDVNAVPELVRLLREEAKLI